MQEQEQNLKEEPGDEQNQNQYSSPKGSPYKQELQPQDQLKIHSPKKFSSLKNREQTTTILIVADEVNPKYLELTMKKKYRWLMLAHSCILIIANYFCYDNPASVQVQLIDDGILDDIQFSWLYSIYAIPNCFLPLFGGLILDKIGQRNGLIVFSFFLCLGQGIFMIGGYQKSFKLMMIGRFFFGVGCESMYVGQASIISAWFINFELPFAISMLSCIPLCGSFLNGSIVPRIFSKTSSYGDSFAIGFSLCIVGFLLVISSAILDYKAEKYDKQVLKDFKIQKQQNEEIEKEKRNTKNESFDNEQNIEFVKQIKQGEEIQKPKSFSFQDLKNLPLPFWLTCINCMTVYISVVNSISIAQKTLQERFNFDEFQAGSLFSLPYILSAALSPLYGWFVDKFGYRMTLTGIGSLCNLASHLNYLLMSDCDKCVLSITPMILQSITYTTYAVVVWGYFPYIVEARFLGTAFGICSSLQNMGTVLAPIVIGKLLQTDTADGYATTQQFQNVEIFFMGVSIVGILANIGIYFHDKKVSNGLLQSSRPMDQFERLLTLKEFTRQTLDSPS